MTTPNSPHDRSNKLTDNDAAYQLGKLVGDVVEEIDRNLTLDDDVTNFRNSLDLAKKDRLEWRKDKFDTYESRSREIDRKWKRY
jgi:hypothetical protein